MRHPHTITPSGSRVGVVVLCAAIAMVDGFDTQAIAIASPAIAKDLQFPAESFGAIFAIGLLGGLVGAVVGGSLSDRFGRRRPLLMALVLVAAGSLVTPLAVTVPQLTSIRFITGIGLGAAIPAIIALSSSAISERNQARIVGLMFTGFPLGGLLAGISGLLLIPALGWHALFVVGGVLPVILACILFFVSERLKGTLTGGPLSGGRRLVLPMARLLSRELRAGTVLLWALFLLSLLVTYLLTSWIPLLVVRNGMDSGTALLASVGLNLGCVLGVLSLGTLAKRLRGSVTLCIGYALGAAAIGAIGIATSVPPLLLAAFFSGAFTIGAQMLANGVCATFYPEEIRATGVGFAVGFGRIGSIIGPLVGGVLVALGTPTSYTFFVAAAVSVLAALVAALLATVTTRRAHAEGAPPIGESPSERNVV